MLCCLCVCARGGFSESFSCNEGGCSVSLSCCDAEAGSQSEITDRLAERLCVSCVSVCADGHVVKSNGSQELNFFKYEICVLYGSLLEKQLGVSD